jgi:hypothetical protein
MTKLSLYLATQFLQFPSSTLLTHPDQTSPSFPPPPSTTTHPPPSTLSIGESSTPSNFLELGSGTGFLACFLAQTGKDRTIWATDVGEPVDEDEEDAPAQRERSMDEDERGVNSTMDAQEVLRKGPLWGLRGNIELSECTLQPPPPHLASTHQALLS